MLIPEPRAGSQSFTFSIEAVRFRNQDCMHFADFILYQLKSPHYLNEPRQRTMRT